MSAAVGHEGASYKLELFTVSGKTRICFLVKN